MESVKEVFCAVVDGETTMKKPWKNSTIGRRSLRNEGGPSPTSLKADSETSGRNLLTECRSTGLFAEG